MDALWSRVIEGLISQGGLASALLAVALVWQTKELARSRKDREEDRKAELAARAVESERRIAAFNEIAKAMSDNSRVLTQLAERIKR